jgi:dihydrofolate synthase/folylpolyglutamate synthase
LPDFLENSTRKKAEKMEIHTLPSYEEILETLDAYQNLERIGVTPAALGGGSERMHKLTKRLGSPHANIPAIHIAGTKGKGSVSHLTAAALAAAGIRTGLYTSPHVDDLRERIQVNGRPVNQQRFVEAAVAVIREASAMRSEGCCPSWFEILTAVALQVFHNARVEAMVLETGLGGRLDATNLPDLRLVASGLTAISRDHEEVLGSSLTAIAAEKAAIIRPNVPAVTMKQEDSVLHVIESRARVQNSPLLSVGKEIRVAFRKDAARDRPGVGPRLDLETRRTAYPDIPIAMLGRHQADNAGVALGLVDLFLEYMDREPLDALVLKRAWRSLTLPARLEVMANNPWHVVDGAHNPASAWVAAETVLEAFSAVERTLIFGVARDKDWKTMLRILAPLFSRIVLTPFDSPRASAPEVLDQFIRAGFPGIKTAVAIDAAHALELASGFTSREGLILTCGSLWLAGEVRGLCRREKAKRS